MNPDELRHLIERNYQIQELQRHDGWLFLVDLVSRRLEGQRRTVLSGKLSADEYQKACGFLEGASYVLEAGDELAKYVATLQEEQNAQV